MPYLLLTVFHVIKSDMLIEMTQMNVCVCMCVGGLFWYARGCVRTEQGRMRGSAASTSLVEKKTIFVLSSIINLDDGAMADE